MGTLDGIELKHLETYDEAGEFMRWLGERRPVLGADTETGGLRWWDDALRLVQFGDAKTGWVISYRNWRGLIAEALDKYDRPIVAHNLAFDAKFLLREGLTVKRHLWHDTLPMHHLLDPPAPHGLKPLSIEMIDPYAHAGEAALHAGMTKQKWTWATVPETFGPYIWYSALDGVLVARLHEILAPQIEARGFTENYELLLSDIWATSVDAAMRGMRIDVEYAQEAQRFVRERAEETRQRVETEYGVRVGSNEQVTARLVADGIELTERTAGGKWKLDKAVIESLDGRHPLVNEVVRYKNDLKFASTYYGGMLDRLDGDVVHADINILGARTRRASVSNPALQQIPSKDWRPRRSVIPREGNALGSVDLSNIEPRIMAHLSQEPTMMEAFIRGDDVHMFMARHMYGDNASKKDRKRSKSGSLGKMFGIGVSKFAIQQQVDEYEAQAFLDFYDATFPNIPQFIIDVQEIARARFQNEGLAYIKDPSGNIHTLTKIEARNGEFYKLVNYVIQGWAAVLLKRAAVRFAQTEFGQYYILPVHDELVLDAPVDVIEEACRTLREIMITSDDGELTIPLAADIEIYHESWAESVEGFTTDMAPRKAA